MTTKTRATPKTKPVTSPQSNKYKANPARGEVAEIINGKHCLFVPSYQNIAVIEDEIDESIMVVIQEMSEHKIRLSKVVPILVHLNDGDPITHEEAYLWIADAQYDTHKQKALVNICMAVLDPQGKRFVAQTESEAEENPNG